MWLVEVVNANTTVRFKKGFQLLKPDCHFS